MRRTPNSPNAKEEKDQDEPLVLSPVEDSMKAQAASTGIPGGAPGVIAEASTVIVGSKIPGVPPETRGDQQDPGEAKVEQYRVAGRGPAPDGSYPILYGSARVLLVPGKLVTSATYDLDVLRSQGVQLEKIDG